MPQTFSHLDAHAKNSFIRPCNGQDEFVLIDWSFAGLAAPGEELAALVASSVMFVPSAFPIRDEIEATAFPAYLEGLSEAGWDGREEDIWRAYRSSLALRYGPGTLRFDFPDDPDEDARLAMEATFGMPFESLARLADLLTTWIADRATEML